MEFASMLIKEPYLLVVILFVLMMVLRSNKKIENWVVQWLVLVAALVVSYIQKGELSIDTILNAFTATGVCLFGENAMFRKGFEKTEDDIETLSLFKECNKELKTIENTCGVEFTQEEIHEIMKKAINEKLERENISRSKD